MSEPNPSSDAGESRDHDAGTGGPGVNAPGNEPDPGSETEQKTEESGRFDGDGLKEAGDATKQKRTDRLDDNE